MPLWSTPVMQPSSKDPLEIVARLDRLRKKTIELAGNMIGEVIKANLRHTMVAERHCNFYNIVEEILKALEDPHHRRLQRLTIFAQDRTTTRKLKKAYATLRVGSGTDKDERRGRRETSRTPRRFIQYVSLSTYGSIKSPCETISVTDLHRGRLIDVFIQTKGASLAFGLVPGLSPSSEKSVSARQSFPSSKLVFAHFMMGITGNRGSAADYDDDMRRAKDLGIDAFALNIATGQESQLNFAYDSAARNNMKVFLSFDCNFYHPGDEGLIGSTIASYAKRPGQLRVGNNRVFVSSFIGDQLNVQAIRKAAGVDIYFAPNFHVGAANFGPLDGALNWQSWQSNGNNKAPKNGKLVTVQQGDQAYLRALGGKGYIAGVSPWFFTHFGREVSYSKNWVFPSDLLLYRRWIDMLALQPTFIEIITWNDYGESHYIGPLSAKHVDDGASKWVNDMPHTGWSELSRPFIAAYKAGANSVNSFIKEEKLIYWYRITSKNINCDSTDTTMDPINNPNNPDFFRGRPDGWETMADDVFVVSLLKSPGTITVNSGGTVYTFDAPAGASAFQAPFKLGAQRFALRRNGAEVMSETSLKPIQDTCPCGLYNFNSYVGTVPASRERDVLSGDSFGAFSNGLKVKCAPTASLASSPPPTIAPTTTISSRRFLLRKRWGDAPIHSFGHAISLRRDQISDMVYQHQGWGYECPAHLDRCTCVKEGVAANFNDNAEAYFNATDYDTLMLDS
uniref:Putative glycoside hydrolase family 71 protein n=1 Tax=Moniliophthora roreri TaxID=221103 RepID=A0A0W0FBU4_MONRR